MEFEAKVIQELPVQEGVSKTSGKPWKKREWVVETFGNYPRKVKIQAFGDRADQMNIEVGNSYRLSVDLESREFNGRWYTDVSVFRTEPVQGGAVNDGGFQQAAGVPPQGGFGQPVSSMPAGDPFAGGAKEDDLPF